MHWIDFKTISKISNRYKIFSQLVPDKRWRAFSVIFIIGFAISISQAFKVYLITSNYNQPSLSLLYPIFFEYLAFSIVAILFPWSWSSTAEMTVKRVIILLGGAFLFTAIYIGGVSWLEWAISTKQYNYWNGFRFTIYHSGFQVLLTYTLISVALFMLGITGGENNQYLKIIRSKTRNNFFFVEVDKILFLEANDNYVNVITRDNEKHLVRQTLASLEEGLDPTHFQRIHRKYIINLSYISSWKPDPNGGYLISLGGDHVLKMSKGYKEKLAQLAHG
ncbi:MAG: LytTR family DNA-binding domain-containing protein [Reichenbachiella sp.]|uniref:LytTR family DNA-binding domain-containing protein n=1 Tax=Reichenbachiella sp. TaxID=2184521 RepID=UPI0032989A66